jgi:uncharacterized protein YidB (DUF937 family)
MDMTDIVKMGTQLFQDKLGDGASNLDQDTITDALSGLMSNEDGGFDLGNIISSVTSGEGGGVGSIVSSWLGDGDNDAVDATQLTDLFGSDKISAFAEKLGIDTDTALSGLSDAVPNIVDKSSEGGNLIGSLLGSVMDSSSGSGGIMGMIGKLFGK